MGKHTVLCSTNGSLHFETSAEYADYQEDEYLTHKKHYERMKAKYGIYASNQGKYVRSVSDLNQLDAWPHPLEEQNDG